MAGRLVDDTEVADEQLVDEELTDEQLTDLALAADPHAALGDDAVSLWDLARNDGDDLLPQWYMPAPAAGTRSFRGWRRWLILLIVVVFVALEAYGLCSAYGSVVLG
ncbi:MAG: hypothetical protein M3Y04_10560 [Actinomycetota bacterium]|nr:hypothetical protein [Actinomycetota bacterium]